MSETTFTSATDGEEYDRVDPADFPDGDSWDSTQVSNEGAPA